MSSASTVTKLKPAQELFLLFIVEQSLSGSEAYARAYPKAKPKSCGVNASRLLANARVIARRAELEAQKQVITRAATRITAEFISKELLEVAALAKKGGQLSAASQALLGVAKIHGFLVDKHLIDAVVRKPGYLPGGPDMMDEASWLQEFGPKVIGHIESEPVESPAIETVESKHSDSIEQD